MSLTEDSSLSWSCRRSMASDAARRDQKVSACCTTGRFVCKWTTKGTHQQPAALGGPKSWRRGQRSFDG